MGVFELHLHEPNFTLNVGGDDSSAESSLDWGRTDGDESGPAIAGKLGPLLVVLAVVVLAMRRNRRRG
ncbi:hypothetical protein [Haladaptatus halobius]|jgi:hypothetical protein|uniref:hypothetical protein n=1 Tax=Haladaptatus halobius TaxID=2884875 RepID=UPI001D09DE8F|nr:hypothetical protein [Haladaptatus halobius]